MTNEHRFKIIGIKPVFPSRNEFPDDGPMCYDKVEGIQKALYGQNRWFYFYQGVTISEDYNTIEMDSYAKDDYSIYDTENLKISLCAVVGKNGSGKSSLIELLVRTLNNMSAALLGEGYNFSAAEHLHFIDNLFADMCFQIGYTVYVLKSHGRHVVLRLYKRSVGSGNTMSLSKEYIIVDQHHVADSYELLKTHKQGRRILKSLFYTMVCNYSLYGFNYRDFLGEATPEERLQKLGIKVSNMNPTEESMWLKGIFHKNDGYQTPIVLHPMRSDGRLDVVKENQFAKERLLSLVFYKDKRGNYPMRTVNGDLKITAVHIMPKTHKHFSSDQMLNSLGIKSNQNVSKNFEEVKDWILRFWEDKFHVCTLSEEKTQREDALDYLVYKTLKIIRNYKKYSPSYTYLRKENKTYDTFKSKLTPLITDYSHITKKLFQTINYLTTGLYADPDNYYELNALEAAFDNEGMSFEIDGQKVRILQNLLPPPIFDVDVTLSKEEAGTIPFSSLSSGERQVAYTISNLMYHLTNVDSEWNDKYKDKAHLELIKYRYMNVIFDEVELYYHPDLQRQFVGILMNTLQSVKFRNLRAINLMIVTHSPFILSDIPETNVLCMGVGEEKVTQTFGGNIMKMLSSSFFMDRSIGEVVREEITNIVLLYNRIVKNNENCKQEYKKCKKRIQYVVNNIGDDFLKDMLSRMVSDIENH